VLVDGDESVPIVVDVEAIRLALWNLLDNAVKYSPAGSDVQVTVRRVSCTVQIAVRDGGLGIPAIEQDRVFDKFSRGRLARERGIGGTGIGLATARAIIRAHDGDIALESTEGAGSAFTIVLPAGADAFALQAEPVGQSNAGVRTA
jgi:signal transduction histidine kinase